MTISHNPQVPTNGTTAAQRQSSGALAWLVPLVAVLALAFGVSVASAGEVSPPPLPAPPVSSQAPDSGDPVIEEPVPGETDWAELEARAERDGSVKVVVELEPGSAARSAAAHLANLTRARDKLIGEFSGKRMEGLNAIEGSPIVAFAADSKDLARLHRSRFVRSVTVDEVHESAGTVSNGSQSGVQIQNWWDFKQIGADWANTNGYTGRGQSVVVIDTGVDRNHGWLSGRVTTEACFATFTNGSGACPGGSTSSYNTSPYGVTGAAAPCTYNYSCAHGTHVAHTAAGAYGTARGAGIVAIQASHYEWSTKSNAYVPMFNDSDLINALWYVYYKLPFLPAAVNLSVGGRGYTSSCDTAVPAMTSYINALKSRGVATVVASGNDDFYNAVSKPACISNAIAVGNTTLTTAGYDAVLGYTNGPGGSNSSASLDLLAPGTDICSAVPLSLDLRDGSKDGIGCDWFGTSMAAPHVAGAIAQLRQSRPTATVDQILSALQRRGSAVTDSRNNITRTRINIANAIYYF